MDYAQRISAAVSAYKAGTPAREAMKQFQVHGAAFYGQLKKQGAQVEQRERSADKESHKLMLARLENKALQNLMYKLVKGELFKASH